MTIDPDTRSWWDEPEGERHAALCAAVRWLRMNQESRRAMDMIHAALYGNSQLAGMAMPSTLFRSPMQSSQLSLNVCRNMVSAATSKIAAKNRPKPRFAPDGGDYDTKIRAERLEKFVDGVFDEAKVHRHTIAAFRDAQVWGTGCVKVYPDLPGKRVGVQRVLPLELLVDEQDAFYGDPQTLYQERWVAKPKLAAEFAADDDELASKIKNCESRLDESLFATSTTSVTQQVCVREAWRKPSVPGGDDGLHIIAIESATLVEEPWDGDFPFAFIRWTLPLTGFWGVGLVEELRGIQTEINKLLIQIQRGHHLITGHYLVESGSKVRAAALNNDLASIVSYSGVAPQYQAPSIIAPEVYSHLWQLYAKAFEISGISQLSATSQKPAGLTSGIALREYGDLQTERFLEVGQRWEELHVDLGKLVVDAADAIGASFEVRTASGGRAERLKWGDVKLAHDSYVLKVYPVSMLPSTPAGKQQWVNDMIQGGAIPPEDVLEIVDFPDTEAYVRRRNAARRIIERNIARMLTDGEPVTPEPADNHALARELVTQAYHEARLDNVPDDRLQLLRDYLTTTESMTAPPPPPPPPPGPPMPPPDAGMAPPPMPPPMPPGAA